MDEFQVIELTDAHFPLLVKLYKKAFGKEVDALVLERKFNTEAICGIKNIGFVAIDGFGEAAALYGVFPCFAQKGGQQILVAQSGDTMVDPKYRRKKLFVVLAKATFDYCKTLGIQAVFGFPNIYSFPSFVKKLNWIHTHNIVAYHTKVPCLPFLITTRTFKGLNRSVTVYQNNFLKRKRVEVTCFKSIISEKENYSLVKDSSFLSYKFFTDKTHLVRIEGVLLWLKPSPMFLFIGDMEYCSEPTFMKVLVKLKKIAFWMGIPHIRFQASEGTEFELLLKKHFEQLENEYPVGVLALNQELDINEFRFILADNDTF